MASPVHMEVEIDYTNHRGERGVRRIKPLQMLFGHSQWHQGPQWLLDAMDLDKNAPRTFAMKDIHGWRSLNEATKTRLAEGHGSAPAPAEPDR